VLLARNGNNGGVNRPVAGSRPGNARKVDAVWVVLLAAHATALAVVSAYVLVHYRLPRLFAVLQPVAIAAAWTSVIGARRRRWLVVGVALLGTLVAAWGYLYVGPLFALSSAVVAFVRAGREADAAATVDGAVQSRNGTPR